MTFRATAKKTTFISVSNQDDPETYKCVLPPDRYDTTEPDTRSMYPLAYLHDIALDMKATDEVLLQFGTDLPCEIGYVRDGVKVEYMLAPRIESD